MVQIIRKKETTENTQQNEVVKSWKHEVLKSLRMLRNYNKTVGFCQYKVLLELNSGRNKIGNIRVPAFAIK